MKIPRWPGKATKVPPTSRSRPAPAAVTDALKRDHPQRLWSLLLPPTFPAERRR